MGHIRAGHNQNFLAVVFQSLGQGPTNLLTGLITHLGQGNRYYGHFWPHDLKEGYLYLKGVLQGMGLSIILRLLMGWYRQNRACQVLVERTISEYGRIDALINNAGIGMQARFEDLPDVSLLKTVMGVNFWGSVYCTYCALPHLKATKGRIVVVISGGGKVPTPGACGYGASKHALAGFFNTLRIELEGSGVSVTAVYPEWVSTGISSRALKADGTPAGKIASMEKGAMKPEVCARMILKAAANREREVMSALVRLGQIMAPVMPRTVDRVAARAFSGGRMTRPARHNS